MKASEAYKTYHDLATGKVQPKPKYVCRSSSLKTKQAPKPSTGKRVKATAKVAKTGKKKQPAPGLETLSDVALTKAGQMKLATKRSLIQTQSSHANGSGAHEGTGVIPGVPDVPTYRSDDEQIPWKSSDKEDDNDEANTGNDEDDDNQDDDDVNKSQDDQDDDEDERTESDSDGEDFVHPKFLTHDDETRHEEDVNEEGSFDPRVQTPSHISTDDDDNDDEIQCVNVEETENVEEATNQEEEGNELYRDVNVNLAGQDVEMNTAQQTNVQTTQVLEDTHVIITQVNPEEFMQTNQFATTVSTIPGIVDRYLDNRMNDATSHAIAANLSELEIKKILIDKIESNKSIHRYDEQKNLYKVLVDAYESDKLILDTYGDTVLFKRRREDEDKDEKPSARSDRRSKRRRARKEPESTSAPKEKTSKTTRKSSEGSKSQHKTASESYQEEPKHTTEDLEDPAHQEFDTGVTKEQPNEEIP
ncbi:hypothetical protein Tco_0647500 [Tanacetum coccineum]